MNIVIVVDTVDLSHGGGVGSFIYDLCEAFVEQNKHNIFLVGVVGSRYDKDNMCVELRKKKVLK